MLAASVRQPDAGEGRITLFGKAPNGGPGHRLDVQSSHGPHHGLIQSTQAVRLLLFARVQASVLDRAPELPANHGQ